MTLQKGVVIDSLPINDSIAESYALYLPAEFTTERTWPVVFVFDNQGRGRTAAQLFRQAGEEQGYIIVASNNISKDSTLLKNAQTGTRLFNSIFNLLPVDKNGIYTAGFAEGAQVASVLPTVFKNVQGVMAIGDVWVNPDFVAKDAKHSFVGLVGTRDYKLYHLQETNQLLQKAKLPSNIYKYEGGNEWPNAEMIYNALGSFTLNAMEKGHRQRDMNLVESLYQAEMATYERLRRMMQYYKAHEFLSHMETKYTPYGKRNEIRQTLRDLGRDRIYRNQRAQYNRAASTERDLIERYLYFFNEDVYAAHFENLGWWNQQMIELKAMQRKENMAEAEMAFRLQGFLRALANNTFTQLRANNASIDPMVFTAILQTIFDEENPEGYKNIISISGQDGDYYTALLYLEDLLKTGYDDMEALYNIPGTLDLKLSPEYNEMVKKYLGQSRYYNN